MKGPVEVDGRAKCCRAKVVRQQQAKDEERVRVQKGSGERVVDGVRVAGGEVEAGAGAERAVGEA
eukprot:4540995-Lingulodinium_polyedra.AAC.1